MMEHQGDGLRPYEKRSEHSRLLLQAANLYDDLTRERVRSLAIERTNDRVAEDLGAILGSWKESAERHKAQVAAVIEGHASDHPLWTAWLCDVKGVGKLLAGLLAIYIGEAAWWETPSRLWVSAGVGFRDGQAQRKRRGERITWYPPLKQLMGKIVRQLVMAGGAYYNLYIAQKERQQGERPAQIDARAKRWLAKIFLAHALQVWREAEGLPVREPYSHEYLGHSGFIAPLRG